MNPRRRRMARQRRKDRRCSVAPFGEFRRQVQRLMVDGKLNRREYAKLLRLPPALARQYVSAGYITLEAAEDIRANALVAVRADGKAVRA